MVTFDMGADTLGTLGTRTDSAHADLGTQVRALAVAAEPLEGRFNGQGRAAFDQFKADSDQIAVELDAALAAVLEGIHGQNVAFLDGEQQWVAETSAAHRSAGFESARFAGR